jgi:hypothetical protein
MAITLPASPGTEPAAAAAVVLGAEFEVVEGAGAGPVEVARDVAGVVAPIDRWMVPGDEFEPRPTNQMATPATRSTASSKASCRRRRTTA